MNLINKELIKKGMDLEKARRLPPFDEKGYSKNFELANKEYTAFIVRYGYLMLEELSKHIKE